MAARSILWAKRRDFLDRLSQGASVREAAAAAGLERSALYKARRRNKRFAAAWGRASRESRELIWAEAVRRGRDGWLQPVFYRGEKCGEVRRYSDTLLIALLKAMYADPDWPEAEAAAPAPLPSQEELRRLGVKALLDSVDGVSRAGPAAPADQRGWPESDDGA